MKDQKAPVPVTAAPVWTTREKLGILCWEWTWNLLAVWTPKPFNPWRLLLLKIFGTQVSGVPFVHPGARIQLPWKVSLNDRACIGNRANLYSLDTITIGENSIIAQEAYLCTGTHQRRENGFPLYTAPIQVGDDCFIGARAFILPGITIGDHSTLGACSVLTRNLPEGETWGGNPARNLSHKQSIHE